MKLPAAHAAHMQRRRLHRVSACAARATGYSGEGEKNEIIPITHCWTFLYNGK